MSNTSGFFLFLAFIYSGQLAAQTTDWQQLPGPIGGSVNTIAQSGNTWYAGTGNGVFQSEDEGLSWEHLDWIPQSESVAGLFISADEILVTALKIDLSGYSTDNWTALLYRSTDSGQSWVVTEIIKDLSAYDPLVIFRHRGQLFITSGYQLFLHSEDNGQTWEEVPGAGAQLQSVQHSDSLLLMENLSYEFFYSENSGETWIPLQLPTGGGSIVLGGGNTIFSFHQINSSYRSTNLGADWLNIGVLFHYTEIKSCKKLPDNTLVAMVENQDNDEMLFTSENNGLTWKKLTGSPYSQPIDVVGSSSALGVATASGFYKNYQGGNFLNPSAKGLLASDITSLAATGNQMLAGAEEGLWRTFDGGNNWMPSYPLGQLRSAVDLQINGDTISTLAARNFFFSTDNGESWTAPYNLGGNSGSPFSIFNLYQMAIEGETVLVGGYGFYTSFNFGESWSEFPGFSQTSGVLAAKGRYFAVEDWDGIKRSLDGGVTWQLVNSGNFGAGKLYYFQNTVFADRKSVV